MISVSYPSPSPVHEHINRWNKYKDPPVSETPHSFQYPVSPQQPLLPGGSFPPAPVYPWSWAAIWAKSPCLPLPALPDALCCKRCTSFCRRWNGSDLTLLNHADSLQCHQLWIARSHAHAIQCSSFQIRFLLCFHSVTYSIQSRILPIPPPSYTLNRCGGLTHPLPFI